MQLEPINEKWQEGMVKHFEALGEAKADESMAPIEEIFHLSDLQNKKSTER